MILNTSVFDTLVTLFLRFLAGGNKSMNWFSKSFITKKIFKTVPLRITTAKLVQLENPADKKLVQDNTD